MSANASMFLAATLVAALLAPAAGRAADPAAGTSAQPAVGKEGAAPSPAAPGAAARSATASNLAAAYEADVHAQARYLAFAAQADDEGHPQAARVFRAAALSERIRAARHAAALRALGGAPAASSAPEIVSRGTRQNLLWMLAHENAERGASYPRYVQQARRDGHAEAVLTFSEAHRVETALVQLYQETLAVLGSVRGKGGPLHVCPDCGYVSRDPPPLLCPVSLSEAASFAAVD